jgi:serine/threonine-protein kinase
MDAQKKEVRRSITFAGRYNITQPLASGGMAEIFLARQQGLSGFEKDVVIKILKDRYRNDARVVEMFLEEARIGAYLNHPNIVHVYDVGEHDGSPFIAMEYIHGEELSNLCRRGLELGKFLPIEHAIDVVRQAAEGMGYFQHKRGEDGEGLDIVHRDISPSNLLVTRDGVLKIIDFGIARAKRPGRGTEPDGLVPGKYNYMSPEQVRGEPVDQRSDIFSLGIVLYEITVGRRLFKGPPPEVIQKITKTKVKPPTFLKRDFPPALEQVIMRALETHPEDRYQSAFELANDLEEYLRDKRLKSGPVRIAQYLDEVTSAEGGEKRPELAAAGQAWVDDDAADGLDFDRPAAPASVGRSTGSAKTPPPVVVAAPLPHPEPEENVSETNEATFVDPEPHPDLARSVEAAPLPPPPKIVEPAPSDRSAPVAKTPKPSKKKSSKTPKPEPVKRLPSSFGAGVLATRKGPNLVPFAIGGVVVALLAVVVYLLTHLK